MEVVSREEFARRVRESGLSKGVPEDVVEDEATSLGAIHLVPEGSILVVRGTPTSFKLHEVGHKVLGHTERYSVEGQRTIGDDILDEMLAEEFSYKSRGKEPTYRLAIPAINMLVSRRYGFSPEAAVFWSLKILRDELGVIASKSERRELARHASGYFRRPRASRRLR